MSTISLVLPSHANLILLPALNSTKIKVTFNSPNAKIPPQPLPANPTDDDIDSQFLQRYEPDPLSHVSFFGTTLDNFIELDTKWKQRYLELRKQTSRHKKRHEKSSVLGEDSMEVEDDDEFLIDAQEARSNRSITFHTKFLLDLDNISLYNESTLPTVVTVEGDLASHRLVTKSIFSALTAAQIKSSTPFGQAQRILVIGDWDSGKTSFCRNWISNMMRLPNSDILYCDMNPALSSVSVPGTLCVARPTESLTPLYEFENPWVWYYGNANFAHNMIQYCKLLQTIAKHVVQWNKDTIIRMPPITNRASQKMLLLAIRAFEVNSVVILGPSADTLSTLVRTKFPSLSLHTPPMTEECIPKGKKRRQQLRFQHTNQYFFGVHNSLSASRCKLDSKVYKVYEVKASEITSGAKLPFAQVIERPLRVVEVAKSRNLSNTIMAVSNGTRYDELALSTVKGFVLLREVTSKEAEIVSPVRKWTETQSFFLNGTIGFARNVDEDKMQQ